MSSSIALDINLPASFRVADILAFHRRDLQRLSEHVDAAGLDKGFMWQGSPACLSLRFSPAQVHALLSVDGPSADIDKNAFVTMVRRMLGLSQNIEAFESRYRSHPVVGPLITRQSGLRVPVTATPFEALSWAIAGQQITVSAAIALRRRLILRTDVRHSSGLLCHPDAQCIARLSDECLRHAGFSTTKARTLLTVASMAIDGRLPLDEWALALPEASVIQNKLQAIRGIGPWTTHYALLRGFGWLDGSLHGDAAVRRGLQLLVKATEKVSEAETSSWLATFEPWRALVAAHIWASQSPESY